MAAGGWGRSLRAAARRPALVRVAVAASLAIAASLGPGCAGDATVEALTLRVTSEPTPTGEPLETLRLQLVGDNGARVPGTEGDPGFDLALGAGLDPVAAPVLVRLDAMGKTLPRAMTSIRVTALVAGRVATAWEGRVDLGARTLVSVALRAVGAGCDVDGDGYPNCNLVGCCAVAGSPFGDCEPASAAAHPWAVEDACEPCSDHLDQDCDGQDAPCVDQDGDGIADCAEGTCGLGDPKVGPGLEELCDGKDNDCDGETDEGFFWTGDGEPSPVGAGCGTGACKGGFVVCLGPQHTTCSTASMADNDDACFDGVDNNCDGQTDEDCGPGDLDGDGVSVAAGDCDDHDAGVFPGAPEGCCPAGATVAVCDHDCDGTVTPCAEGDLDGDGHVGADDCDETRPDVYVGAPERCGDDVDQDCFGGDLSCDGVEDLDGDGWPAGADCDDTRASVGPWMPEVCDGLDQDCDGLTDEGNPGAAGGASCGTDLGECETGVLACVHHAGGGAAVECAGEVAPTAERCDGRDNDCDGATDEIFELDGKALGAPCEVTGRCGEGHVECAADGSGAQCSSAPGGSGDGSMGEVCNGQDDDCDGLTDEDLSGLAGSSCLTAGVCGAPGAVVLATCRTDGSGTWDCDYSGVPGYAGAVETLCDGLDDDCDGYTDEDFGVGTGCDGDDADACANGALACAADGVSTVCVETGEPAAELCDGEDNDCDGQTDEDFPELGQACDGPDADLCARGIYGCAPDGGGLVCGPEEGGTQVERCNSVDDDCDGETDEDFPELGQPCDGPDADQCANGIWGCAADGSAAVCGAEAVTDIPEVCDGKDDDCDGATDELAVAAGLGQPCDGPDGDLCPKGTFVCRPDGSNTEFDCDEPDGPGFVELCNGVDDDCDGETDEGFALGVPCDGGDADKCLDGWTVCDEGDPSGAPRCEDPGPALVEVCDAAGADEDCDGAVNEDWPTLGTPCSDPVGDLCKDGVVACAPAGSSTQCVPVPGTDKTCVDGDLCTADSCDPALGCVHTAVACDDGSSCTTDSCDPSVGCVFAPITCDDGDVCTVDTCDPSEGCVHAPDDCADASLCTDDSCQPGVGCVHTTTNCDDGDACTTDGCNPGLGCVHIPVSCDDGDPCTVDSCTPATGCVHEPAPTCQGDTCASATPVLALPFVASADTSGPWNDDLAVTPGECVLPNTASLALDGVDDRLVAPADASLNYSATPGLTVSLWVKLPSNYGQTSMVFAQGAGSWYALLNGTRSITWRPYSGLSVATGTKVVSKSVWTHLAFTYDNTTFETHVYVDGALVGSGVGTKPLAHDGSHGLTVGRNALADPAFPFAANVDDVALFPRVLTAAELADLQDGSRRAPAGLAPDHWWRMGDGDAGTTVTDHGLAPVDATFSGGASPTYQADTPQLGTAAGAGANDLVYAWTAPADGAASVSIKPEFSGVVYVTTSCADLGASCLGVNLRPAQGDLTFPASAGETYFVVVDGAGGGDAGAFTLSLTTP